MNRMSYFPLLILAFGMTLIFSCKNDDNGPGTNLTPEQEQTAKLLGTWVPGTVSQEVDGDVTAARFADFSIEFKADAQGENRTYSIVNTGGEAFETGANKAWNYVSGNLGKLENVASGFQFDVQLTESDTKLKINLSVDPSGSPLGRVTNTTGGYEFNLVKQ